MVSHPPHRTVIGAMSMNAMESSKPPMLSDLIPRCIAKNGRHAGSKEPADPESDGSVPDPKPTDLVYPTRNALARN